MTQTVVLGRVVVVAAVATLPVRSAVARRLSD